MAIHGKELKLNYFVQYVISKLAKNEQGVSLNVLKSRIRMRDCQSSLCTPGMCSLNYSIVRNYNL